MNERPLHGRRWTVALTLASLAACTGGDTGEGGGGGEQASAGDQQTGRIALLLPERTTMNKTAPELFRVKFETSKGDFVVEVRRDWAPNGADRFYYLATNGFYDDIRFFRVMDGFMAQFGLSGDPKLNGVWRTQTIPDDPVTQTNDRGYITYAMAGPNSRTTQAFINYRDNSSLDGQGFAPFGVVAEGMDVIDALHAGYGDGAPRGNGPSQGKIRAEGNAYLDREFPELDRVTKASLLP